MKLWTTFAPGKVSWELTTILTQEKAASSNWLQHQDLIKTSLSKLQKAGIVGIRLVIFPSEITQDGKIYNWKPIDTMLDLCHQAKLDVDLCIGPFQYPHYPGIYLPPALLQHLFDNPRSLDTTPALYDFGMKFLELQIQRYGTDRRIHGFHLANEWPDRQAVAGKETIRTTISTKFMIEAVTFLKKHTEKPISLNTNIDVSAKRRLKQTFGELLTLLGEQGQLGFDIYPSQETWEKAPVQKLRRLMTSYQRSFAWSKKTFSRCELYFAEVEAQPWGNGQSWYRLIQQEPNPHEKVLTYTTTSLLKTWKKHIAGTQCQLVSLWGSDFWLSAEMMDIRWPLEAVKKLSREII